MKKFGGLAVLVVIVNMAFAQGPLSWRLGIMALPHNGWLLSAGYKTTNGTLIETHTPEFTFNTNLGIVAGLNFTDLVGVELDVIFGKFIQDFSYNAEDQLLGNVADMKYSVEISKTDLPLLLKVGGLVYFELGPQYTMISKVETVTDNGTSESSDYFKSSQISGILGGGAGFSIPKIARIELGLRLGYGFMDISAHKADMNNRIIFDDEAITQAFWGIKIAAIHKF